MDAFAGWPDPARALVERSIERHGGWTRWRRLERVTFTIRDLHGLIPWLKGLGRTHPRFGRVELRPHAFRATVVDYPAPGHTATFERGAVRVVGPDGSVLLDDPDRRRRFRRLGARLAPWRPADAVYFFGYALTYYQSLPFLLARCRPLAVRPRAWRGCDALTVDFPDDVHTHCRRQTFFFDPDGRIRRHDYTVDIIGWWARGCHLWSDFDESSGIPVARTRHVLARALDRPTPGVALHGELADIEVEMGGQ